MDIILSYNVTATVLFTQESALLVLQTTAVVTAV